MHLIDSRQGSRVRIAQGGAPVNLSVRVRAEGKNIHVAEHFAYEVIAGVQQPAG
jgi:hypothetical protein